MAERRVAKRQSRHFQVRFIARDTTESRFSGFTTNISESGVFIATNRVLARGTRLRLQIGDQDAGGFVAEGVVARSLKVSPHLHRVRQGGMGVRFLTIPELVRELLPGGKEDEEEDARHEEGVFRLSFSDAEAFRTAFERDVATGGLFVSTKHPAEMRDVVKIEVRVESSSVPAVVVEARVVHRFEPEGPAGQNLMAGMGVEFTDPEASAKRLRLYLDAISL